MSEELKLCPFCGSRAEIVVTRNGCTGSKLTRSFMVRCRGCGVSTEEYDSEVIINSIGNANTIINGYDNAEKAWNRRKVEVAE